MKELEVRYLERLSQLYPTIAMASTEIINLQAILNLPKGTEHFLTDIHGEYEAFSHVLKNGSGAVRRKVDDVFGNTMSSKNKQALATLIYYPKEKMERIKREEDNMEDWYKITLYRLIKISKRAASKYTRSKVRKSLPEDFAYVIEELITEKADVTDKNSYYNSIVSTIIQIGRAEEFIIALSELIQRLSGYPITLLCTSGQPRTAAYKLMELLCEGCEKISFWYAGDMDPEGLDIAQRITLSFPGRVHIWRMSPKDYEKALSQEQVSQRRIEMMKNLTHPVLKRTAEKIREWKRAGYQEMLIREMSQDMR